MWSEKYGCSILKKLLKIGAERRRTPHPPPSPLRPCTSATSISTSDAATGDSPFPPPSTFPCNLFPWVSCGALHQLAFGREFVTAAARGGPPGRGAPYISISASHRLAAAHAPSPVTVLVQLVTLVCPQSWNIGDVCFESVHSCFMLHEAPSL